MPFARIPRVSDLLPGAIRGLWTIGDPASWHVEIGTHPADGSPSAGASGIRLYGSDGVTVLIDLHIGATPTITGALIRTAAAGQRWELDSTLFDRLQGFTGDAAELTPGRLLIHRNGTATDPGRSWEIDMASPSLNGHNVAAVIADSASADGSTGASASLLAGGFVWQARDDGRFLDPDSHPIPRFASSAQRIFDAGSTTDTTNAAGTITIPHDLGSTPIAVVANIQGAASPRYVTVSNKTSTTFDVTVWNGTTADPVGINRTINWLAVG